ncbi:hypothetical protein [uncultured Thiocystis sp.]|uniref:hypothetical protein n=1 Tax=uncultured Thiocystis sp. TaxID=1202134 RepID=UPI0025E6256C|nr:hypothetical protein [uncultured Thiocystis sp.]
MRMTQAVSNWLTAGPPASFKSHWYYWYTAQKPIAILSMILSIAVMTLCLTLAAGCSIWGIIVAVLLDSLGFWLTILYVFVLRTYIPELAQDQMDSLVATQLALPLLLGFFIVRVSTFLVASAFAAKVNRSRTAMNHG